MDTKAEMLRRIDATMDLVVTTEFEIPAPKDGEHIGLIGWSMHENKSFDVETAVLLLRFVYQLGREQGRREAAAGEHA